MEGSDWTAELGENTSVVARELAIEYPWLDKRELVEFLKTVGMKHTVVASALIATWVAVKAVERKLTT